MISISLFFSLTPYFTCNDSDPVQIWSHVSRSRTAGNPGCLVLSWVTGVPLSTEHFHLRFFILQFARKFNRFEIWKNLVRILFCIAEEWKGPSCSARQARFGAPPSAHIAARVPLRAQCLALRARRWAQPPARTAARAHRHPRAPPPEHSLRAAVSGAALLRVEAGASLVTYSSVQRHGLRPPCQRGRWPSCRLQAPLRRGETSIISLSLLVFSFRAGNTFHGSSRQRSAVPRYCIQAKHHSILRPACVQFY